MCIRDRAYLAKLVSSRPFIELSEIARRFARKLPEPLHKACLLYTSDAADERSSVDLGGRRIIKKQTIGEGPARRRAITEKID